MQHLTGASVQKVTTESRADDVSPLGFNLTKRK